MDSPDVRPSVRLWIASPVTPPTYGRRGTIVGTGLCRQASFGDAQSLLALRQTSPASSAGQALPLANVLRPSHTRDWDASSETPSLAPSRYSDYLSTHPKLCTYSIYKKLAVQWLNEALCFVSSSVLAGSLVLRNHQLLVAAKRWATH